MALADAEHDQLWDVIRANGATNSRLITERDEARAALARVRVLCDGWIDLESSDQVHAARKATP
jgi:hypothetical protein